jgi:hypothetical protein
LGAEVKALHILQHSLGLDEYGRGPQYRNHFVTGEGSDDHPLCMALVKDGLMERRGGSVLTGGDDVFIVTHAGIQFVADNSPTPPKLTRSQKRYQGYLDADCGLTFGEWLRWN